MEQLEGKFGGSEVSDVRAGETDCDGEQNTTRELRGGTTHSG